MLDYLHNNSRWLNHVHLRLLGLPPDFCGCFYEIAYNKRVIDDIYFLKSYILVYHDIGICIIDTTLKLLYRFTANVVLKCYLLCMSAVV
jgi:hypothetical protein